MPSRLFCSRRVYVIAFILIGCLSAGWTIVSWHVGSAAAKFEEDSLKFDQPDKAQEFYLKKRLPPGEQTLPVERYLQTIKDVEKMPQFSTATASFAAPENSMRQVEKDGLALSQWTFLGPGNVGGRTRAIVINPIEPNIIYAAGVAGGVWKSNNGGASWTPMSDLLPNLAVASLALDSSNPNIIYAGTGESITSAGFRGAGIFKTTDGGTNWTHLPNTGSGDFYHVNSIVISQNDGQRVYAGTDTGVWRSSDGGINWSKTLNENGCHELAVRTDRTADVMFASCGTNTKYGTNTKIYRNSDTAGQGSWNVVLAEENMGLTSLAIAPSNQNIIYAMASASSFESRGILHAFFRSSDGGTTWTARVRDTDSPGINNSLFSYACYPGNFGQGWYDNVVAVDPLNADKVWAGGIYVFRSDDGGANWGLASSDVVHTDIHALVFHPRYDGAANSILYVGSDGGISKTGDARGNVSPNCGNPVISWTNLNNNYGVTQFYHGMPYPDGTRYLGGTQDNGTIGGSDASGTNAWTGILGGDGGFVAIDPNNTDVIYAESQYLNIQKITNGGSNYTRATNGIIDSGFLFIVPFVMDPNNSQILWTGGDRLWRTTNGAQNWMQASGNLPASVSALAVARQNSNKVLAGTTGGTIYRTTSALTADAFSTWQSSKPRDGYVSGIAFDPLNTNIVYAVYSSFNASANDRHIYKSIDGGASWSGIDGAGTTGIPDHPVLSIVVDSSNSSRIYVGTDIGVFVTLDGGGNWARENTGFANAPTEALAVTNFGGNLQLFAFTHGRGAWRVSIPTNACTYSIASDNGNFSSTGGNGSFNLVTPNVCGWSANSGANWIKITGGVSGSGNGTINFTVDANTGAARAGTIFIGGQIFYVNQAAPSATRRKKILLSPN